jgi:hypothetical protein
VTTVYQTSWIDRFVDRVVRLPVPWYVLAGAGWLILSTVLAAPLWIDGSEPFGSFPALTRVDPAYFFTAIVGYGYLSRHSRRAFDRFRPALSASDAEAAEYRLRISTLSRRTGWLVLLGIAISVPSTLFDDAYSFVASPVARVVWGVVSVFAVVAGGFFVLIVKQLFMIARLHREATQIDLFRPAPLHAFASLSARAGSIVLLIITLSILADPGIATSPLWRWLLVAVIMLAFAAFFLPLIGLSRRLRVEKRRLVDESATRISAVRQELHRAAESRSFDSSGDLRTMLSALSEDHDRIRKLSPWPWDMATVRGFATTLLLPIGTWLVTNLLNRALF